MQEIKNSSIENIIELIVGKLGDEYYQALMPMMAHLKVNGPNFLSSFQYHYMKYVYDNISKKKSHIQVHTGFGRRAVETFLDQVKFDNYINKNNKTDLFNSFIHVLENQCQKNEDKSLAIYGPVSFTSLFDDSTLNDRSVTSKAILEYLVSVGCLRKNETHVFWIDKVDHKFRRSKTDIKRQFTNITNDWIQTTLNNVNAKEESEILVSRTVSSNFISDEYIDTVIHLLNSILKTTHDNGLAALEEYESKSNSDDLTTRVGFQLNAIRTKRTTK